MEVLLFWIPLLIVIGSIISLFMDEETNRLDWVISQTTSLYTLIGVALLSTIWVGVALGMSWPEANSARELAIAFWDNSNPLSLFGTFFGRYDGGPIIFIFTMVALFGYRMIMSLYYHFTGLKDYKVISTYVQSAWYYESWTERCTRIVTETDSKGNTRTRTETYYVYHPPYWEANLEDGMTISISSKDYRNYCDKFGNETFENIARVNQSSSGDGNAYYSNWPQTDETMVPAAYKTEYLNFITASRNTVLVSNVDEKKYDQHLEDDPHIEDSAFGTIEIDRVITKGIQFDETVAQAIDLKISKYLAKVGTEKDVNIMFYFTDRDINFWYALHEVRQGGRFNEVLVVVGIDPTTKQLTWCKTMAWDNAKLCSAIDNGVMQLAYLNGHEAICNVVTSAVDAHWAKPSMDKYRYLASDITLPWGYVLLGVCAVTLVCAPLVAYFYNGSFSRMWETTISLFQN